MIVLFYLFTADAPPKWDQMICSPQEAMWYLCACPKTFVHAEEWSTNLSLIFTETNKNTFMLQMDETGFLLL